MTDIEDIHPMVEDILNALTFRQKSVIANMVSLGDAPRISISEPWGRP